MTKKNQKEKLIEHIKESVIKSYILGFSSGVLFVIILAFILKR